MRAVSPVPPDGARACLRTEAGKRYAFGRAYSLGRNKNYQYVYKRGKSFPGKRMTLVFLRAKTLKAGFSASSKLGNAVTRNRLRRRLREDFRMLRPTLPPGKYIFVARGAAVDATPREMASEMRSILRRAKLLPDAP